MATLDVGKIKFTWKGAYADTTVYEADDVAQFSGSSYVYIGTTTPVAYDAANVYQQYELAIGSDNKVYRFINATPTAGQDPTTAAAYWEINEPGTTSPATLYWDLMADGTNILTAQGDVLTHDGTNSVRLPKGASGTILKMDQNDVAWGAESGFTGTKILLSNYGRTPADPNAATTYGANGSRPWLADYANDWIPQSGIANPDMGPVKNGHMGIADNQYRGATFINDNYEIIQFGYDYYYKMGQNNGNASNKGVKMAISQEFGGMLEGDYFVRVWASYGSLYALTKMGNLFAAGHNGYGQLGVGDTTDRYQLVRIPTIGANVTHNGLECRIAGFHTSIHAGNNSLYDQCYAIDEHGRLFVWGYNGNGCLGIGNTTNQSYPQLASVSNVIMVSAGVTNSYCVDASRELYFAGSNTDGVGAGVGATTSWTSTSATNVYQIAMRANHHYSGGWVAEYTGYYLATNGQMYGCGENGNGQIGDGTTTDKSAWTNTSGSTTFAYFFPWGQGSYSGVAAIEGTPGSISNDLYVWGYNGNGQLGLGTTTSQNSPIQPQTVTNYTRDRVASTDSTTAPTLTASTFPRNDIVRIFGFPGMQGTATGGFFVEDNKGRTWWSGYTQSRHYWRNNTGNTSNTNFVMETAPWNTTETLTGDYNWVGKTGTRIHEMCYNGYSYNSEGTLYCVTEDGRLWAWGYNGQRQIENASNYIDYWVQVTPS